VNTPRTPLTITLSVWKALFLREALSRLSTGRAAWVWLLAEPIFSTAFLMFIYTALRMHTVGGISTAIWLMLGMLSFLMFRRTGTQAMNAIDANQALFGYRQVKPVDTVLVRAFLEGFLMLMIMIILCVGAGLSGLAIIPPNPLLAIGAFFGLWLIGLGFGLLTSVSNELVPEVGKIIDLFMTPLYFFSGVIFPVNAVPHPYYDWLMLNPLIHGVEAIRVAFAPDYRAIPELSTSYLYGFALVTIFFGLALHNRFAARLVTQ
jgi:capsular polysaccharide transport system permease protein